MSHLDADDPRRPYRIWRNEYGMMLEFAGPTDSNFVGFSNEDALALANELIAMLAPQPGTHIRHAEWTPEVLADLEHKYLVERLPIADIARYYGTTTGNISTIRNKHGIPPRNQRRSDAARKMHARKVA